MIFELSQEAKDVVPGWTMEEITKLIKLGYFDNDFYLSMNPDIASSGANPLMHYLQLGWREGRQPSSKITQAQIKSLESIKPEIRNPLFYFDQNR
jgi:hypothetical protein